MPKNSTGGSSSKKPRKPTLRSKLVKDLRKEKKDLRSKLRQVEKDLRSLGAGRKKKSR